MHLGRNNPMHHYMAGKQFCRKGYGVLVNMTQQCVLAAKKASHVLGCIGVQLRGPQYKRDMDTLERVQQRATRMKKGLEQLFYEERLRELGLFILKK